MSRRRTPRRRRSSNSPTWLGLLAVIAIFTLWFLVSAGYLDLAGLLARLGVDPAEVGLETTPAPAAETTTDQGAIEVFFTTPTLVYPDQADNRVAPAYERAILADIAAAARSIDLALYEYNLDSIAEAIVRAHERGVQVRLALDRENLDNPAMAEWAGLVEEAGIPIAWEESDAFQHSKFVIVDERLVWTGSWNATINDTYRNNNNLLRITLPAIVANYQAEFELFDAGRFSNSKNGETTPNPRVSFAGVTLENYFSPRDTIAPRVVEWIDQAEQSVEFLAFSFTSDPIADAVIGRYQAGVAVRGVFEKRNAAGLGSEYERLLAEGVDVLPDGNCYTMHHKVIIIDGRIVITGSYNFTGRAENTNDENLLIIDDPVLARAYQEEFERVYGQAQSPLRCG